MSVIIELDSLLFDLIWKLYIDKKRKMQPV